MTRPAVSAMPGDQAPPHNLEVEQALLGAVLNSNAALDNVAGFLRPEHFFNETHQRIYRAVGAAVAQGRRASPVTLASDFKNDPGLVDLGGPAYLARLAGAAVNVLSVEEYGRLVLALSIRRDLLQAGRTIAARAASADTSTTPEVLIAEAEDLLTAAHDAGQEAMGKTVSIGDAGMRALQQTEAAMRGEIKGLRTGITALDRQLGGFQAPDLMILAGRPSMGKTALAISMAYAVAKQHQDANDGHQVAFYSREMGADQLAQRLQSMVAGIPYSLAREGRLNQGQFDQFCEAQQALRDLPFMVRDSGSGLVAAIRADVRRLTRRRPVSLVVIDYLQLLEASEHYRGNRVQEVSEISKALKSMAADFKVPVIALSQLSRQVEQREDKRPQLPDLRESGSIEQDADVVAFVYRDEYYERRKEPAQNTPEHAAWAEKVERIKHDVEVIVGKARAGRIGTAKIFGDLAINRFADLDSRGSDS